MALGATEALVREDGKFAAMGRRRTGGEEEEEEENKEEEEEEGVRARAVVMGVFSAEQ